MAAENRKGQLYRCPICDAEIAVLTAHIGKFRPRCCNTDMQLLSRGLVFYVCPVCGAELAVLRAGEGEFELRCCNTGMVRRAA